MSYDLDEQKRRFREAWESLDGDGFADHIGRASLMASVAGQPEMDALVAELTTAPRVRNVPRGVWRNRLGAELDVIGYATRERTGFDFLAGDIALAIAHDDLFGDAHYLVTEASLAAARYELVGMNSSDSAGGEA